MVIGGVPRRVTGGVLPGVLPLFRSTEICGMMIAIYPEMPVIKRSDFASDV